MKKAIPIILIVLGILLLLTPMLKEEVVKYYSKSVVNEDLTNEILKANNQKNHENIEFDFSAIDDVDVRSIINGSQNLNKDLVIGILYIPDLDINLPIMKGMTNANLMVGTATMKADQELGTGNYTLAGHQMKRKDLLFGSLMDIEIGSKAYLSDGKDIYEYDIYDIEIVADTAMEMLDDDKADKREGPILSLMTCYHTSKSGKRFFALGELVDKYPVVE